MKTEKREKVKIDWYGICPYCDQQIKSATEEQLIWNMNVHINQKHPFKEKVTKTKEESK